MHDAAQFRAFFGIGIYLLAAVAAMGAAVARGRAERFGGALLWLSIAALMLGLAYWRFIDGDEILRGMLRELFEMEDLYDDRRQVQGPVIVILFAAGGLALLGWQTSRMIRGQLPGPDRLAGMLALGFAFYSIVRAVSLHPIDRLIYTSIGPANLNRIIDIGLSAALAALALYAIGVLPQLRRSKAPHRHKKTARRRR